MTGEDIGLRRLEALPYAGLSLDAQEMAERKFETDCTKAKDFLYERKRYD